MIQRFFLSQEYQSLLSIYSFYIAVGIEYFLWSVPHNMFPIFFQKLISMLASGFTPAQPVMILFQVRFLSARNKRDNAGILILFPCLMEFKGINDSVNSYERKYPSA